MIGALHRFTTAMRLYANIVAPEPEVMADITALEAEDPAIAVALYMKALLRAYNEEVTRNSAWYRYNDCPVLPELHFGSVLEIRFVVNPERLILRVVSDESLSSLNFCVDQRHRQLLRNDEPRELALMVLLGPLFRYMWNISPEDIVKLLHRAGLTPAEIADVAVRDDSVPSTDDEDPLVTPEQAKAYLAN